MDDLFLLFSAIFDSELKFILIDLLEKNAVLELNKLVFLTGKGKKEVQQTLWNLQNAQIVERIDEHTLPFLH